MTKVRKNKFASSVAGLLTAVCMVHPAFASSVTPTTLPVPTNSTGNIASAGTVTKDADIGNAATYRQTTSGAVVGFNSFNIGKDASVSIKQPGVSSVFIARIGDQSASKIYGSLTADGNVVLINRHGIVLKDGSSVHTGGGFTASTSDLCANDGTVGCGQIDQDAAASGEYNLTAATTDAHAKIINKSGKANAQSGSFDESKGGIYADGGKVVFVGPTVINKGSIRADNGLVALVGNNVTNEGLIQANITNVASGSKAQDNKGAVDLEAGDKYSVDLYGDNLINLQVSGDTAKQVASNSGTIHANGGTVLMTAGAAEGVINSLVNMDGVIEADSVASADGKTVLAGSVTVQGDTTTIAGTITATGDTKGGSVTTTGTNALTVTGTVDASAANGTSGTWAINSNNVKISDVSSDPIIPSTPSVFAASSKKKSAPSPYVSANSVSAALSTGTNVTVTATTGNVDVAKTITKTGGADASLTLTAAKNVVLEKTVAIEAKSSKLNVFLSAGKTAGSIVMNTGSSISSNGGAISLSGGAIDMEYIAGVFSNGGNITLVGQGNGTDITGILLDDSNLYSNGGKISITGSGYDSAATNQATGVTLENGSVVNSRGTASDGVVTITGTGGNGVVSNGSPSDFNYGVYISGTDTLVASGSAATTIVGNGGGLLSATDGSARNYGVFINDGAKVKTTSGVITVSGIGGGSNVGCSTCGAFNYGVYMDGTGTAIASKSGDIVINGTGGVSGSAVSLSNYGIYLAGDSSVKTKLGAITLTGIGGGDNTAATDNYGIRLDTAKIGGKKDSGQITLITDTISMSTSTPIQTAGAVFFEPYSDKTTIGVADGAAGTLQLNNTVLDNVTAGSITIGNTTRDTGDVTLASYTWRAPVSVLTRSGNIIIGGTQTMNGNTFLADTAEANIVITKTGSVTSTATGTPIVLAADGKNGSFINYRGSDALSATNGRWLVYSYDPTKDIFGGLNSGNTAVWDTTYSAVVNAAGNRYAFVVAPTLTITAAPLSKSAGIDYTSEVAADYTLGGTATGVAGAYLSDDLVVNVVSPRGAPASARKGRYGIYASVTDASYSSLIATGTSTLTVSMPSGLSADAQERSKGTSLGKRGPTGTLLSIVNGASTTGDFASLAPKAGGEGFIDLADLSPSAGGNGGAASITPLIQCNEATPCDINQ